MFARILNLKSGDIMQIVLSDDRYQIFSKRRPDRSQLKILTTDTFAPFKLPDLLDR